MITLEDIIEEIVGEIVDELDTPQDEFNINKNGNIITNGSKNIKDLYKEFNLNLPESDAINNWWICNGFSKKNTLVW